MPNPSIAPAAWADGATYTVTNSGFAAVDIDLDEIDEETAQIILTVPAGGVVAVLRNPVNWSGAGTPILSGGVWTAAPVPLGDWQVSVTPGGTPTAPATVNVSSAASGAGGLLRILLTGLADQPVTIEPGGGTISIDRVLADPTILNVQVFSPPLPVHEKDAVTLSASVQHTVAENGAPATPLPAPPALLSVWSEDPANLLALTDFNSLGATATFTAPAAFQQVDLSFTVTAALDLAANGVIDVGDPQTTEPLEVEIHTVRYGLVLVLDRSGSMASGLGGGGLSKWDVAVQAAHVWSDIFRVFRPGNNHLAGVVTFEHDGCTWTPTPAVNITFRNPANHAAVAGMTPLAGLGSAANSWDLGDEASCTPIGDALVKAWQGIGSALGPDDVGAVILMTDGYENAGRVTIAQSAGPATTTFAAERVTAGLQVANQLIADNVYTLGIGSSVDEDRLNDLGSAYYQKIDTDLSQVMPAFAAMLGHVIDAEERLPNPVSGTAIRYLVPAGEQRLAVALLWSAITHRLRLSWRPQSGGAFTIVNATDTGVTEVRRGTHGVTGIDLTALPGIAGQATEWELQHFDDAAMNPNAPLPVLPADALAMVDLKTKADVGFDRRQYFLGEPIGLRCHIRSGGVPVTDATVGVDCARPGEGLGTFLTTYADRYRSTQPSPGKGDPLSGKGLMFKTLLNVTDRNDLPIVVPPQFQLFDAEARGNFTNAFADTAKEGTYTFRFRVEGQLADGSRFSSMFVRSTWVGVRPDPALLNPVWSAIDGLTSTVTFKPQYKEEYLGPYRTAVIKVHVANGTASGPLIDNIDGSYTQRVKHERGVDPIVSIEIYGTPMVPTGPGITPGASGTNCWHLWRRAFRCTLIGLRRLIFGR